MSSVLAVIFWVIGTVLGSYILLQPLIIFRFAKPFTRHLHQVLALNKLQRDAILSRTTKTVFITTTEFIVATLAVWNYAPQFLVSYGGGVLVSLALAWSRCGYCADNVADFLRAYRGIIGDDCAREIELNFLQHSKHMR